MNSYSKSVENLYDLVNDVNEYNNNAKFVYKRDMLTFYNLDVQICNAVKSILIMKEPLDSFIKLRNSGVIREHGSEAFDTQCGLVKTASFRLDNNVEGTYVAFHILYKDVKKVINALSSSRHINNPNSQTLLQRFQDVRIFVDYFLRMLIKIISISNQVYDKLCRITRQPERQETPDMHVDRFITFIGGDIAVYEDIAEGATKFMDRID